MAVQNALAGVAVTNLESAAGWYQQLIGVAGGKPMAEVVEWTLPSGGGLQLFEDERRAGSSSVTLSVTDIDRHIDQLIYRGIPVRDRTTSSKVSTAIVDDPDGNQVVLAQQHSDALVR